jgi:GT2 family glycosyltransferase
VIFLAVVAGKPSTVLRIRGTELGEVAFFSVIIPTFNRLLLLKEALNSVWRQRFTDYEVIVVDDGSTDGTLEYLEALKTRITCLSQSNQGPGAARNLGARHAKAEYLAFFDSDDMWFPWTLACFAALIARHGRPTILSAKLVEFSSESELAVVTETHLNADVFADYLVSHRTGYFVGAGMSVLRRSAFLETGGYTDRRTNAEDHDLILRMGTARGFVQVTSPITLGWRRHCGNATNDLRDTLQGCLYLIAQERRGMYPGGPTLARARRDIITSHARPLALGCLRQGLQRHAWTLYRMTFVWNLALGRWKYLAGFPLNALWSTLQPRQTGAECSNF